LELARSRRLPNQAVTSVTRTLPSAKAGVVHRGQGAHSMPFLSERLIYPALGAKVMILLALGVAIIAHSPGKDSMKRTRLHRDWN
jgi:hypothetical protein